MLCALLALTAAQAAPAAFAGVRGGLLFPRDPLAPALTGQVELGARLPWLGGRLQPALLAGWAAPQAEGEGEADGSSYRYALRQRTATLAAGLAVRLYDADTGITPELFAAPQLVVTWSELTGTAAGSPLGASQERTSRVAWLLAPGIAGAVGSGAITGHLLLTGGRQEGALSGDVSAFSFAPTLGYRRWW